MRECGSCTLCCKLLAVTEIAKPAGIWCEHCTVGAGCQIHSDDKYPPSCKVYNCLWKLREDVPLEFKPDAVKAVMGVTTDGEGLLVYARTVSLDGVPEKFKKWLREQIVPNGKVIVVAQNNRRLLDRR